MAFEQDHEHEHAFFVHEDPRWLICRCGQYAERIRTVHGQPEVRLIDPPKPVFAPRTPVDLRDCPQVKAAAAAAADAAAAAGIATEQAAPAASPDQVARDRVSA